MYTSTLAELTPCDRGSSVASSRYEKRSRRTLAEVVDKLITSLQRWCTTRKPHLPYLIDETLDAVQDCDPYLVSLLMILHDHQ